MIQLRPKFRPNCELISHARKSKLLGVILGIFAVTALANAQTGTLILGSGAGTPGSGVVLDLALATGGAQPTAVQWTLQYSPSDITSISASIGSAANSAGKSLACNTASGSAMCVIFGLNQSTIADGTVAQLTFTLAPGTTSTSTAIQVAQVILSDSAGTNIPVSVSGGSIAIVQPVATFVSGLSCNPTWVSPNGISTCVVTLSQAAPGSGVSIGVSSNNANISVPASVIAIAGATTANFTATAGSFTSDGAAQVTASLNGGAASSSLTLATLSQVSALNCNPASLNPGGTAVCVVTLSKPAAASGATIALSSNSGSVSVPASATATAGATTASFTAAAGSFTSNGSAQITASLNGGSASASLTLTVLSQVSALICNPTSLSPNGTSNCVVTLSQPAPGSGALITLISTNASVSVPASVTATAGAITASFTAAAGSFTSNGSAQITASLNGGSASAALTLTALSQVSTLSCNPASLSPNGTSNCVITLSQPAPGSGAAIALSSNNATVSVPASVTATAGATTASFTAAAKSFTSNGSAQITVSLNGQSKAFTLALKAAAQIQVTSITCSRTIFNGGDSSTCKVTLSSAPTINGSITLSSNTGNLTVPASVAIASGYSSAQFTVSSILVDVDTSAVVTASFGGSSQSTTLTVIGIRPTSLTCSPLTLSAGGSTKCTVQLNRPPQTRAITLLITSSSTAIQAPQTLSTKSQQTQYSFTVRAATFAAPGTVQLSAAYRTSVASINVSVLAPAAPALAAPAKMTATVDTPVTITAQAQDLSGLNVNLSADNLPTGASFTVENGATASPATAGVIQWIPTTNQVGTYSVKLGAQSAAGTTSQKLTIQVASQVPQISAVVNAASLSAQQVCSPGSLAVIQGTALQIPSASSEDPADQTYLTVNGIPSEVTDASATQITFRCPKNSSNQKLTLLVSNRFGVSSAAKVTVQNAAPGIYTLDGSGTGQGLILVNGTSNVAALPDPDFAGQVAAPGDTLTLLMTGLPEGLPAASVAQVTIGQITAQVLSVADVSKSPGVQMLTVRVPQSVPVGDSIPVQVLSQTTNAKSNTVTIAIEQAN